MKKRILALVLCALMIVPLFCACSHEVVESYLQVYLTHQVYDLDPLSAFSNESQAKILTLIFSGLYKIDENGKVTPDLVKSEEIINDEDKDEYTLRLTLRDTCWSDGSSVSADDAVYTFKRVLNATRNNDASCMLFKIKNAIDVKNGEMSIDDLLVFAQQNVVEIKFVEKITPEFLEEFRLYLTSPALFPLRENMVEGKEDWAKKPATMVFDGPYLLRKVSYENGKKQYTLERNSYYMRDREKDAEDKYVTPLKIYCDYEYSAEDQVALFENEQVLFVGEIPLSLREQYKDKAKISDIPTTHTYYYNQNRLIKSSKAGEEEGVKLFAIPEVRKALNLAIDREAIANEIVFAKPATGLLSNAVFATSSASVKFRDKAGDVIATTANKAEALSLLASAGINPSDYTFTISVRECDTIHNTIAAAVAAAWCDLGFNVTVKPVGIIINDEKDPTTKEDVFDIRDDLYDEDALRGGDFDVLALDLVGKSPNAFSILAPFALDFTGNKTIEEGITVDSTHITGYASKEYNRQITKAFNARTADARISALIAAEKILLDDAAVCPITFCQNAVLISDKLSGVTRSYYGFWSFTKANLKGWEDYRQEFFPETTEAEETAPTPAE